MYYIHNKKGMHTTDEEFYIKGKNNRKLRQGNRHAATEQELKWPINL